MAQGEGTWHRVMVAWERAVSPAPASTSWVSPGSCPSATRAPGGGIRAAGARCHCRSHCSVSLVGPAPSVISGASAWCHQQGQCSVSLQQPVFSVTTGADARCHLKLLLGVTVGASAQHHLRSHYLVSPWLPGLSVPLHCRDVAHGPSCPRWHWLSGSAPIPVSELCPRVGDRTSPWLQGSMAGWWLHGPTEGHCPCGQSMAMSPTRCP